MQKINDIEAIELIENDDDDESLLNDLELFLESIFSYSLFQCKNKIVYYMKLNAREREILS